MTKPGRRGGRPGFVPAGRTRGLGNLDAGFLCELFEGLPLRESLPDQVRFPAEPVGGIEPAHEEFRTTGDLNNDLPIEEFHEVSGYVLPARTLKRYGGLHTVAHRR